MQVKCGTYTGTGSSLGVTGVGFQPDAVWVAATTTGVSTHFRTSAMAATVSIQVRGDASQVTDAITVLNADGFTLGTSGNVNTSGRAYYYIAVKGGSSDFAVGTFTGNATDGNAISGLGFQPNYVMVKCNSTIVGASKYSTQGTTNAAMQFGGDDRSDLIQIDADGFTVNNGSGSGANLVNVNAVNCYYVAFKEIADFCEVFQYSGNATDNRDITTPGFQPGFVFIKSQWGGQPAIRTSAHSGDNAQTWDGAQAANVVQAFISTGFTIGTSDNSNQSGATYNVLCVKEGNSAGGATRRIFLIS